MLFLAWLLYVCERRSAEELAEQVQTEALLERGSTRPSLDEPRPTAVSSRRYEKDWWLCIL